MKRTTALALAAFAAACSDSPSVTPLGPGNGSIGRTIVSGDVVVTNVNDAGPGSFRDAIAQANNNPMITTIGFRPGVNTIRSQSTIAYHGTQDLAINANLATLDASDAGGTAFLADGGGDLKLIGLTVKNAAGHGVQVEVPDLASGTIRVVLDNVDIIGNSGHGFLVNDQANPETADPAGSPASVEVTVTNSRFLVNGYSVSDRDGIRINEGGDGDLTFRISNSRSDENAADGIELDERSTGNVLIDVSGLRVTHNGSFDPLDLDDGFDIDEADDGGILGQVTSSSASHNFEEGLDFNENDAGDLRVDLTDVEANFNREEGIDYEEDDDFAGGGDLVSVMDGITTIGNGEDGGDGGLKIREKGAGNLDISLTNIIASRNLTSGIHIREAEAGDVRVAMDGSVTNRNTNVSGAGHGIEIRESSSGSIAAAAISNATTSDNAAFGVSAENGTVTLAKLKGGSNAFGLSGGGANFVVVP